MRRTFEGKLTLIPLISFASKYESHLDRVSTVSGSDLVSDQHFIHTGLQPGGKAIRIVGKPF